MVQLEEAPLIGGYHLTKELFRDCFGITYSAARVTSEQPVLLQVIDPAVVNRENFIVRFELLKGILPSINHPNLLKVHELGRHGEIAYVVREHPAPEEAQPLTLAAFDPKASSNRHRTLEALFEGMVKGLQALADFRGSYYKEGIAHDLLVPEKVYIQFEKALVGGSPRPVALLDGFWESFLYYGDAPFSPLHYRMDATTSESALHPYSFERYLSPASRRGENLSQDDTLFALGALIFETLTGTPARGILSSLQDFDPTLDSRWETILNACFHPTSDAYPTILTEFKEMSAARTQLTPQERTLKNLQIPDGMALVTFDEKVELGAVDGPLDQQPRFRARLDPFLIDIAPVTVDEFSQFQKRYQPSSFSSGKEHPATGVSWTMAKAYLRWRDDQEGLPPGTYRLPTEYEWEAAMRGSSGEQYPWGPLANPSRLRCGKSKEAGASPVKQYPPGRFGIYDGLGNVFEWTESIYKPHPFSEHVERQYAAMHYVVKGGCWFTPLSECRASLRASFAPHECRPNVGFRAVRPVKTESLADGSGKSE